MHAVVVAATVVFTLALNACSGGPDAQKDAAGLPGDDAETVEYGLFAGKPYDGTTLTFLICCPQAAQFQAWRASVPEFAELTGIDVRFTDDPLEGLRAKIITQSVADPGSWDVTIYFDTWGPQLENFLEPLENVMPVDLSGYPPATVDLATINDTVYGIPARSHVMMLYYRDDVLDQLGLAVPETYDELLETARSISSSDLGIEGFTLNWAKQASISPIPWIQLVHASGARIFSEEGEPTFDTPEVLAATEVYHDLADYAPNGAVAYNEGDNRNAFAQGDAAMTLAWSWSYEVFADPETAAPEVVGSIGYSSVIPGQEEGGAPIAMTWPIGISESSENKGAAAEWIKWLTNPDLDREIIVNKDVPGQATVVANRLSSLRSQAANEANSGFSAAMADAYEAAGHQPIYENFPEVSEIIEVALSEIMGGADIEQTLHQADAEATQALNP